MNKIYIDYNLIEQYPNKYNFTQDNIKTISVKDWNKLRKETWYNTTLKCYTKVIGCGNNDDYEYLDENEFFIKFYDSNLIKTECTCYSGICAYDFKEFYNPNTIENEYDMQMQVNVIKFLNYLVDNDIVTKPIIKE